MKKKTLVALLLVLALACVPLVGCGGNGYPTTKKLNLNNYVESYSDTTYGVSNSVSRKAYTTATTVDGGIGKVNGRYGYKTNEAGKRTLYDFVNRADVLNGKTYDEFAAAGGVLAGVNVTLGETTAYDCDLYEATTLALLTSFTSYAEPQTGTTEKYINGKLTDVFTVAYRPSSTEADLSYKYFVASEGSRTDCPTISEVNVSSLKNDDYTVGSVINHSGDKEPLYKTNGIKTDAEMGGYSLIDGTVMNKVGLAGKYEFFKDGAKTGEIAIKDGRPVGVVGKYFYYAEIEVLPYDAKEGYNYIEYKTVSDFTTATKLNYTYYRYDIVKNKVSKYNPGYIVVGGESLYNYKDSKFDALMVYGYKMVDGVASNLSTEIVAIADKDLKVGVDFTGKPYPIGKKLKDNRFIGTRSGVTYIYNEKLETVAAFKGSNYHVNNELGVITFAENDKYAAIDFDGNVVLEAKYTNLEFYGNTALTGVYDENNEVKARMAVSKTNPNGTELAVSDEESLEYSSNGIVIIKKVVEGVNNFTVKNYDGTVLASFTGYCTAASLQYYVSSVDGYQYAYLPYSTTTGETKTIVFGC